MFIGLAMPTKPLLLAVNCLASRATAILIFSCLALPIFSWANPKIQPELILSIDARGIEQSGISRLLEEKYESW